MADQEDLGPAAQMIEAGEEDDVHAPVFIDDEHGQVVADLDEEDDAPMSDSDDDDEAGGADMEDRDAAGEDIVPPSDDAIAVVSSHSAPVYSCAWSTVAPDVFATGGGDDVAFLHRIADGAGGVSVSSAALRGHTDTVSDMRFNHDGSLLATAGLDGRAMIWNASDGSPARTLEGPGGGLEWVRWHPKGNVLLAGSEDFTAWMWNAADGALMQVFSGHSNSVMCGGFSPDGKTVATGSHDGSLRVWQPRTGECSVLFMGHPYHDGPVTCLDFHPTTQGLMLTGSEDNTARLVSASNGKVLGNLVAHTETLECVGLSGDFPFAASGAIDAKLVVWDLNTLQPRNTLAHDKAVSALRWIPGTACLYRCAHASHPSPRLGRSVSSVETRGFVFLATSVFFSSSSRRARSLDPDDTQRKGLARLSVPVRRWTHVCEIRNARHSYGASRFTPFANEQPESGDTPPRRPRFFNTVAPRCFPRRSRARTVLTTIRVLAIHSYPIDITALPWTARFAFGIPARRRARR